MFKSKFKYYLVVFLYLIGLKKRKGILVYLGVHKAERFSRIFYRYAECYGFEANPQLIRSLPQIIKWFPNVHIYNKVVSDTEGEIKFNISNNEGASSSIGVFKKEWVSDVKMVSTITVSSINLMKFLSERNVDFIDDYISDIQGFDLHVLKTIKPLLDAKKVQTITCETAKDEYGNVYENAPDNSFSGFKNFLDENYECVSKGYGTLQDGIFNEVPQSWWEFDAKWRLKRGD